MNWRWWYYTGTHAEIELLELRPWKCWSRYSYYWKRCLRFGTCEEHVGEPHLRHFRPAIEPTTILENEQLRLDAATMVVGLSWSWAPLQSSLGHDVPEFMIARRKAAQVQAYALPRSHLMHGTEEVWRQLGAWFWNSVPQGQSNGTSAVVEDSLQYRNFGRF